MQSLSVSRRHAIGLLGATALVPSLALPDAAAQGPTMQSWPLGTARPNGCAARLSVLSPSLPWQ